MTLYLIPSTLKPLFSRPSAVARYFGSVWNYIDLISIFIFVACIGLWGWMVQSLVGTDG